MRVIIVVLLGLVLALVLALGGRVLAEPSQQAKAHYQAGLEAKQAKDYDKAILQLKQALELDKDYVDARWVLAWIYVAKENKQLAGVHLREVIRLTPDADKGIEAKKALVRLGLPLTPPVELTPPKPTSTAGGSVIQEEVIDQGVPKSHPNVEVYVTWDAIGNKYHREGCVGIPHVCTPMLQSAAIKMGCKPCELCRPDLAQPPDEHTWLKSLVPKERKVPTKPPPTTPQPPFTDYPGGRISPSNIWGIWYKGLVPPDADTPAWTEHISGTVAHSCTNGRFKIADDTPAEYLYYTYNIPALDNTVGTLTDVRLRIIGASGGENQGACLSVSDGKYQFVVWLRTGTLNIDGEPKAPVYLVGWHRLQFSTQGTHCEVFIDGVSIQTGTRMDLSANKQVAFGSWVPSTNVSRPAGLSISEWDWFRVRRK